MTPKGICTKGAGMILVANSSPSLGSSLQMESLMISIGGSKQCKALAMTDFAVPRRPAIATPPNPGSIAAKSRANLIASCPTTAVRGKAVIVDVN